METTKQIKDARFYQWTSEEDHKLTVKQEINLTSAIIPARYYPILLEANRTLSHPGGRTILVSEE